jgi:GT2 family glycosyltransferase
MNRFFESNEPLQEAEGWSASVVIYRPSVELLDSTLASLAAAVRELRTRAGDTPFALLIVDNGGAPDLSAWAQRLRDDGIRMEIVSGHGNVGFGCGHDLALRHANSRYHIVLNPDVDLAADSLVRAAEFLDAHPEAGLIAPRVVDESGHAQFLCRRYPSVLDLFVRGFLPRRLRAPFARRLAHYEMRDVINDSDVVWDPPITSGCFMLFRTSVLKALGGFDPRYFLYFEDYDLSWRAHEAARVAYVPSVRIAHHGGGASRKGWRHIRMFVTSAVRFFNRFGWKWL